MPKSRNKRKNREKNRVRKLNEMNRRNNERRELMRFGLPLMMYGNEIYGKSPLEGLLNKDKPSEA